MTHEDLTLYIGAAVVACAVIYAGVLLLIFLGAW